MNDSTARIGAGDRWTTFTYLAVWSYLLYGLGNATPYLRYDLHLTAFEAGLHASALAVGVLVAGATADILGRRAGRSRLFDLSAAYFGASVVLIVIAQTVVFTLCAAFLMGLGGGTVSTQANVQLSEFGHLRSRILISQANAFSMIAAAAAPIAIGLAASGLHAWRLAMVMPVVVLIALTVLRRREGGPSAAAHVSRGRLPRSYWVVWLVIVIGVAIEFSFVYWGSTIVALRTGVSTAEGTLLASLFVVGMFAGRTVVGGGVGSSRSSLALLATGLGVVVAGASLTWVSTVPVLSGLGLFMGGCGVASLWPIGITAALQAAGVARLEGAARATFGAGLAILFAPAALGIAGDAFGVVAAWPIIIGMATCGLAVAAVAHRVGSTATPAG